MKRLFFAAACILCVTTLHSQSWAWAEAPIPEGMSYGEVITTDPSGNVCVAYDEISASPPNYMNIHLCSGSEAIVAKHSPSGQLLWSRGLGGREINAITTDKSGNIIVAGVVMNTGIFCGSTASQQMTLNGTPGIQETFVAKYDTAGNLKWAKLWQLADNMTTPYGVKTDGSGNIYVPVYYGPATQNNGGYFTLLKYDAQGALVWQTPPVFRLWTKAIDVDDAGNSYIAGFFGDSATIGNTKLTGTSGSNAFVAKIDGSGQVDWAKSEGTTYGEATGISLDRNGSLYVTGWFVGPSVFGNTTLDGFNLQPLACTFLIKCTLSGTGLWAKQARPRWSRIAADSLGCFLGAGNEMMVTRYNAAGAAQWTISPNGSGIDWWLTDLCTDRNGACYFTGRISDSATFGTTTLAKSPQMGNFGFIAKIGGAGSPAGIAQNALKQQDLAVYPNPASDELTVTLSKATCLRISDMLGQTVAVYELTAGVQKLNIAHLSPGVYTINNTSNSTGTIKIIKH
jgi:hypothetical protein